MGTPQIVEKLHSRKWYKTNQSFTIELIYIVTGSSNDSVIFNHVQSQSPTTYQGCARTSIEIEPDWVDQISDNGSWIATVKYEQQYNDSSFSFDTGGGTQHITQSLETVEKKAASGTPPDFKGAIGVTHDNVEGVDITVPVYQFSETYYWDASYITPVYKTKLFNLTGKVNNDTFRGLAAGECLFLGASGSRRGVSASDKWEITYKFAGSPNKSNITIGDITISSKKGWEYLWVRYTDVVDDDAKRIVKRPMAAYVEKVYESGDFGDLGIGE